MLLVPVATPVKSKRLAKPDIEEAVCSVVECPVCYRYFGAGSNVLES
jgi:hypothetical protein